MADSKNQEHAAEMPTLHRNIRAVLEHRRQEEAKLGWSYKLADVITNFAGSMLFVWLHIAVFGAWILTNIGIIPGSPRFDPTLVLLATTASVEAIFLSTFILITQNKMQSQADKRADLNLQISLLAEHEITRLITMVSELGAKFDVRAAQQPGLDELKQDVRAEKVLENLDAEKRERLGKEE